MTQGNSRQFFEALLGAHIKGDREVFFSHFDNSIRWTIHGENAFTGCYRTIQQIRDSFDRFEEFCSGRMNHHLMYLIVEGNRAAALLSADCPGKDGKSYRVDYWWMLELSKDGKKLIRVENYLDAWQLLQLIRGWSWSQKAA